MQKPSDMSMQKPSDMSMQKPSDMSMQKPSDMSMQKPSDMSMQKPSDMSMQKPSDMSMQKPSDMSMQKPSDMSMQKPSDMSMQKPSDMSMQKPSDMSMQKPSDMSMKKPSDMSKSEDNQKIFDGVNVKISKNKGIELKNSNKQFVEQPKTEGNVSSMYQEMKEQKTDREPISEGRQDLVESKLVEMSEDSQDFEDLAKSLGISADDIDLNLSENVSSIQNGGNKIENNLDSETILEQFYSLL